MPPNDPPSTDVFSATPDVTQSINNTTAALSAQVPVAEDVKTKLLGMAKGLMDVAGASSVAATSGLSLGEVWGKIGASGFDTAPMMGAFGAITGSISGVLKGVEKYSGVIAGLGNQNVQDIFNPLKDSSNLSLMTSVLPEDVASMVKNISNSMKQVLAVQETAIVGFTRLGLSVEETNAASSDYPNTLRRMATAYSMTGEKLDGMMKSMQGIPVIMDQNAMSTKNASLAQRDMVSTLGELSQAAKTFGMNEQEAAQRAKTGYLSFNQTASETISSLATMSAAAKQTVVDRKIADEQIVAASGSLAMFGQKSDAAAGTWATFTSALKDTVPIQKVGDLVKEVTDRIAGMSVQNRAFISMMSGMTQGKSAMGGALQLELAMRSPEGMEKNLQALTSTLSQFAGGQVITLEEAANNPQLEMQFQMQREMLGKVASISDPQQQNRVLEVLQKVQTGGMSQVEGAKELSSLTSEGKNIQEKQLTSLEKMENHLRMIAAETVSYDKQLAGVNNFLAGTVGNRTFETNIGLGKSQETLKGMAPQEKAIRNQTYVDATAEQISNMMTDKVANEKEFVIDSFMNAGKRIYSGIKNVHGVEAPTPVEGIKPATQRRRATVPEALTPKNVQSERMALEGVVATKLFAGAGQASMGAFMAAEKMQTAGQTVATAFNESASKIAGVPVVTKPTGPMETPVVTKPTGPMETPIVSSPTLNVSVPEASMIKPNESITSTPSVFNEMVPKNEGGVQDQLAKMLVDINKTLREIGSDKVFGVNEKVPVSASPDPGAKSIDTATKKYEVTFFVNGNPDEKLQLALNKGIERTSEILNATHNIA